ncbi:MAG TPA: N,N-dimethylformamidase beta subunit family domain-containing protein, partial [Puia sp.]|nr:N,N-dimethylformamidase beta subunit family domain-containing protein [Puia sp.]
MPTSRKPFTRGIWKFVIVLVIALFTSALSFAQPNPIVTENNLTGTPESQWDLAQNSAGDESIQGFATDISVNKGGTVQFKIDVNTGTNKVFDITIYRLGYYQGNGARKIVDLGNFTGTDQSHTNACLFDNTTGLTDCGNWAVTASWNVPSNAVSGVYIAKLTRSAAGGGGSSHIVFIVRDDSRASDIIFKTSDATWQAYNEYGGYSLYIGAGMPYNHGNKVSYNRPFITRTPGDIGGPQDFLMNAEYPTIRFLEANGYDVSYTTDLDIARDNVAGTNRLLNHRVFLSVGHDEYWSKEERNSVEAAKTAGKNLIFFSGNEVYWKTRWENSVDGTNTQFRTLVCYKEGKLPTPQENACQGKCDPDATEWTGLWRDGCDYPGVSDACKPENALTGTISWGEAALDVDISSDYKNFRFWRNTPNVSTMADGGTYSLPEGVLGYEFDYEQYQSYYPLGRVTLSNTAVQDINGQAQAHKFSLYKSAAGGLIFGAGTCQWAWGLDQHHDYDVQQGVVGGLADLNMQQATINLLADMGVKPDPTATLLPSLSRATQSTDVTPPASVITYPLNGATVNQGQALTITGTATESGGGVVAGVDISVDGGTTWQVANGTTNWSFEWTPTTLGPVIVKTRSFDDLGNLEAAGSPDGSSNTINVTVVTATPPSNCQPCTIFDRSLTPVVPDNNDGLGITLGVKFRAAFSGTVSAVWFYKAPGDQTQDSVHLWSFDGNVLGRGEVPFNERMVTGWINVPLETPVHIDAGVVYVATYHDASGYYVNTDGAFTSDVINGPLTAIAEDLSNPEAGYNGTYAYDPTAFPNAGYNAANYFVDVDYTPDGAGPDVTPPVVSFTSPANLASDINVNSAASVTFDERIDPTTISGATVYLKDGLGNLIPATVSYTDGSRTATLIPSASLNFSSVYTATIVGGATDPRVKDLAGNALANNYTWSFTTAAAPAVPPDEGSGGPVLIISSITDLFSRYTVEILRAEGYTAFDAKDISEVTPALLDNYDVIVLGHQSISPSFLSTLTTWVTGTPAGGGKTLIALRPDASLASLMGLTPVTGTSFPDKYIKVNTSTGLPGFGIVGETIQYHGTADAYTLSGASSLATLYSDANTATTYPAVTVNHVGGNGGNAVAFTYDLARSVVYTRQGNPAYTAQKRDGQGGPIRSDDKYYPDYVDFNKIQIPQADEQQHLLTNIILQYNLTRKPLPHVWFLPNGVKAAVVMTGDDHATGNTAGRFDEYLHMSDSIGHNTAQDVTDWKAIRGTSYIYPGTPITDADLAAYQSEGFEIALHPYTGTGCLDFTPASLNADFTTHLQAFHNQYPSLSGPVTNRTHCMPWSDWATHAKVENAFGMRFDVNYYYWPGAWIQNRPGLFTGSGMPMRFADDDGSIIDVYQAPTQIPDESDLDIPTAINTLLDNAINKGYYGAFVMNMHTDTAIHVGSNEIIASALTHNIPVVTAKQMLTWLDNRNNTVFGPMTWSNNQLSFSLTTSAHNLQAMVPYNSASGTLQAITENGSPLTVNSPQTVKGVQYVFFPVAENVTKNYVAIYSGTPLPITLLSFTVNKQGENNA